MKDDSKDWFALFVAVVTLIGIVVWVIIKLVN